MKQSFVMQTLSPKLLAPAVLAVMTGFGGSYAVAQTSNDAQQRYQADVERCRSGQTSQDTQTCLREAGAALQEARRNRLVTGSPSFQDNQRARCDGLTGTRRDDCLHLMSDSNATVHGSIAGGGVIRESTITIPGDNTTQTPSTGGLAPAGSTQQPTPPPASYAPAAPGLTPAPAPTHTPSGGLAPAR